MKVSIIGTGYVGLVTGACLAEKGHRVVCVDTESSKVAATSRGAAPFHQPGLDNGVERAGSRRGSVVADHQAQECGRRPSKSCLRLVSCSVWHVSEPRRGRGERPSLR